MMCLRSEYSFVRTHNRGYVQGSRFVDVGRGQFISQLAVSVRLKAPGVVMGVDKEAEASG